MTSNQVRQVRQVRWLISFALGTALTLSSGLAIAKDTKAAHKAESKMMSACKKEYPEAVKGKSFKEVSDWVETEEHGANADTFKKSKCYNLHEDWEKVAGQQEKEKSEHKSE